MKTSTRVAKNTLILYFQMAITVFVSLYTTRIVLEALGAKDFGIFNVVGGAIAMMTFLNAAMAAASQRFMSYASGEGDLNKQKKIFNISITLHIIIALLIVVLLEITGYFLFNGVLNIADDRIEVAKYIYQFLIISTFFTIVSVPYDAVINAHENMFFVAVLRIVEVLSKLGVALYIFTSSYDKLFVYGLLMSLIAIILLIIRQTYCHYRYAEVTFGIKKYADKELFKEMTSFAGWSFLGTATGMLSNYGQGIVLNMYFGTTVNASQGIANQVSGQLSSFSNMMLKALNPVIAKSEGAGNRSLLINSVMIGGKFSFFLLAFFAIPFILEMPYILGLWLKEVPKYAVIFCRLLLIKNLQEQLFITLGPAIGAVGNIKKYQIYISILGFSPLIITAILFSWGYDPFILYIIFIIQGAIRSYCITLYYANKNVGLPIKDFLINLVFRSLMVIFISYVVGEVFLQIFDEGFLRLILIVIVCSVLSLLGLIFVVLRKNEKEIIYGLILPLIEKIRKK